MSSLKNKIIFVLALASLLLLAGWYEVGLREMKNFYEDEIHYKERQLRYANIEIDSLYDRIFEYEGRIYLEGLMPIKGQVNAYDTMRAMSRMFRDMGECEVHFTVRGGGE